MTQQLIQALCQFVKIRAISVFVAMNKGFNWLLKALSQPNSFASIRVVRGHTWLAGISKRSCADRLSGILEKI